MQAAPASGPVVGDDRAEHRGQGRGAPGRLAAAAVGLDRRRFTIAAATITAWLGQGMPAAPHASGSQRCYASHWSRAAAWHSPGAHARRRGPLRPVPAPSRRALAAQYLAIAKAGNRRLDHEFDRLDGPDRDHLKRSRGDLRAIAATERLFDHRLSRIAFGPRLERVAHSLYHSNQKRAALTTRAAGSSSLPEVREYERRLNAANRPVERAVRTLRHKLGLPPPPSS